MPLTAEKPMKIILKGRIPSKKNQKQIFYSKGKPFITSSENYKAWHEEQSWLLPKLKAPLRPTKITALFYSPDERKGDLSNKWQSCEDLFVDNGIIEDDNWKVIRDLHLIYKGTDKQNPRVEIEIE